MKKDRIWMAALLIIIAASVLYAQTSAQTQKKTPKVLSGFGIQLGSATSGNASGSSTGASAAGASTTGTSATTTSKIKYMSGFSDNYARKKEAAPGAATAPAAVSSAPAPTASTAAAADTQKATVEPAFGKALRSN